MTHRPDLMNPEDYMDLYEDGATERYHTDGNPLDYVDDDGMQWVMCACGHRMGGAVEEGEKYTLCPNCMVLARFQKIEVVYPERLPEDMRGD